MSEFDIPLNTPQGQGLLGAQDLIAEEAFSVVPEGNVSLAAPNLSANLPVTDPCEIPDPGVLFVGGVLPVNAFTVNSESVAPTPIVTIRWDGRVEVNPAFTVDEAARAFWDAVIAMNPIWKEKTP